MRSAIGIDTVERLLFVWSNRDSRLIALIQIATS